MGCDNWSIRHLQPLTILTHIHSMTFPHLTQQTLTLDGSWQDDTPHSRFTGTLSSSAPFVTLSLLKSGETYHYMKHTKSDFLGVPLVLYQMKFPTQNRYQHTLSIAHSVILGAHSEGRLLLPGDLPMTFDAGQVFTFARDTQHQPFIGLLAIAKTDITSKRNGIWALKPHLVESLEEPWRQVLSKTRYGFIDIPVSNALLAVLKKWTFDLPMTRAASGRHIFETNKNWFALILQVHGAKPIDNFVQQASIRQG